MSSKTRKILKESLKTIALFVLTLLLWYGTFNNKEYVSNGKSAGNYNVTVTHLGGSSYTRSATQFDVDPNPYIAFVVLLILSGIASLYLIGRFSTVIGLVRTPSTSLTFYPDNFTGLYVDHYADGKKKCELNFKDGKKNGMSKWYYAETGGLDQEAEYKNNLQDGVCRKYSKSGELKFTSVYKNGVKI
jgi:hypothetical protein